MKLKNLEKKLSYTFSNRDLLSEALTHKSYSNERRPPGSKDNERLEFLGDAVLDLLISEILFIKFPEIPEGDLSKKRASLVREETLSAIARDFRLGDYLSLGKGEALSGGREKSSLLANTFEALIAAVYLDSGLESARRIATDIFTPLLSEPIRDADYKSTLQEALQKQKMDTPTYRVLSEAGPDHNKTFEVILEINSGGSATGYGKSIKEAEQMAAKNALEQI